MGVIQMSLHTAIESLKEFIATLEQDAQDALVMLGKISPELTTAAVVAETISGNEELIPLTEASGKAAEVIGAEVDANGIVESAVDATAQVKKVIKASKA